MQRFRQRMRSIWLWIVKPNQVGKPIRVQPSAMRGLILLIVVNLALLGLMGYALFQVPAMPTPPPLPQMVVATPTPQPSPSPGPTPTPFGSGGAIAFTLRRNGNSDIYAFNQDDQRLVRLTDAPSQDRQPAWSPDGQLLAFASNRADNWDIYLLDLVSGAPIRLTQHASFDGNPSWSPDGAYIAFESYRRGNLDIYTMSTSGREIERITTGRAPDYEPAWSPDSRAIAFTSFRDGNKDIYLYLVEERKSVNLTNSPDIDEDYAAWSPDGTELAYVSGSRGNPSIQVMRINWETVTASQAQTELLGGGSSPAWAPDGRNLIYVAYERQGRSHLIATGMTGWAISQEVYSIDGMMDDLAWTETALSPRMVAQAQDHEVRPSTSLYVEMVQPTPTDGPPYTLVPLTNVERYIEEEEEEEGEEGIEGEEESAEVVENTAPDTPFKMSDRVNESFSALRQQVIEEAGWDYLGTLESAWVPMTFTPPSGHSRMNWHVCGRAIAMNQAPYEPQQRLIELVREDVGSVIYWRLFLRTTKQDGSMGQPLREAVWDLYTREEGGQAFVEGGTLEERIPSGYYVDFTTMADDYGWERVPALWRWRYSWPDIRWWELQKTDGLDWWQCMLEIFEPQEIEAAFGPIPGYEESP